MFANHHRAKKHFALAATFIVGLALGAVSMNYAAHAFRKGKSSIVETRATGYRFIEPLVECDPVDAASLSPLKDDVDALVGKILENGDASHVSVYFRDLNDGHSFAVNPKDDFIPASLLKVPIMMNILKIAQGNRAFLRHTITIPENFIVDRWQSFPPRELLKPGGTYTVEELLHRMIAYSDNSSAFMLTTLLPNDASNRIYKALGVNFHERGGRRDWISVETYASFFRVLYNATFLDREMSEKALALLAQADTPPGIHGIAPEGVVVAKKFGHFSRGSDTDAQQLHLCGIVYHHQRPYLVCVMSQGDDVGKLAAVLSGVWSEVYRAFDAGAAGKAYSLL